MKPEGRRFDVQTLNAIQRVVAEAIAECGYAHGHREEAITALACLLVLNCAAMGVDPIEEVTAAVSNTLACIEADEFKLTGTTLRRKQ